MRLRTKAFSIIALMWLVFTICASLPLIQHSVIYFVLFSFIYFATAFTILYVLLIKRIEMLSTKISVIDPNNIKQIKIDTSTNDELSLIVTKFNILLQLANLTHEQYEQYVKDHTSELEIVKMQLKNSKKELNGATSNDANIQRISNLAHYDNLTALPNHVFFNEILNKTMSHSKRHNKILAVLNVELDAFDNIVDLGASVRDQALKEIASRFAKTLRSEDILARLDGNEFLVLLNDIGKPKFASAVAEKLLQICSQPIQIDADEVSVTCSIGICIYPNDGQSLEELHKNVSSARDKAKQIGGNSYQFYTHEMDAEARVYIQHDTALRNAISNNELSLHYQPKLHIKNGNITGVEGLLRWTHPTLGVVSPATFIPLAEEIGLIMDICEFALFEACKINKFWQDEGYEHVTIAVNLSPKQFYNPEITQLLSRVLAETGLNPSYLELEIAERTVMDNVDAATTILEKIKALGVKLSIDHFGTGYTSISHLKRFPISTIKIDPSFIKGVPNIPNDMAITNAFIALTHNLGLEIVAEGVETAEQVQYLAAQQCDIIQGYFLSHPMPAQKIVLQFKKLADEVLVK